MLIEHDRQADGLEAPCTAEYAPEGPLIHVDLDFAPTATEKVPKSHCMQARSTDVAAFMPCP